MAEDEDLEVPGPVVLALLATADEQTDECAGDEVDERPHRPIVPGRSESESGFPTPTGPETGQDAGLPVDQRAVAVEGQRVKGAVVDFGRRRQIGATAAIRDQPLAPPVKFHDARWSVGTR
jgi:hypothetical protein